jgi:hypothetical protein
MSELAAWRIEDVKGQCLDFVAGTLNAIKAAQSFANARDETIFIRRVWKGTEQRRAIEPVPEAEQNHTLTLFFCRRTWVRKKRNARWP